MRKKQNFFILLIACALLFLSLLAPKASFAASDSQNAKITSRHLTLKSNFERTLKNMVIKSYLKKVPLKFKKYFSFGDFVFNVPYKNIKTYLVRIEINEPNFSGYHTAVIKLLNKKNGSIKGLDILTFKTKIYAPVAVASRTIGKFQIIKSKDVKISYKSIPALTDVYYLDDKNVIGREAKFFIAEGSPLTDINTERKRLVNFGSMVNIVYNKYGLILKTKGMALQAGASGSLIRVKNIESGAILNCVVKSPDTVMVR